MRRGDARDELRKLLRASARRARSFTPSRAVGRAADGTVFYLPLDGECTIRGSLDNQGIGDLVLRPAGSTAPTRGIAGASSFRLVTGTGVGGLQRQVPRALERNRSQTVVLHGAGFQPTMRIEYLRSGEQVEPETVEPEIRIDEIRVLSGSQAEVDLTVSALAPLTERGPIAYDLAGTTQANPPTPPDPTGEPSDVLPTTALPFVAADLYSIVRPQGAPRYLALWRDPAEGRIRGGLYGVDLDRGTGDPVEVFAPALGEFEPRTAALVLGAEDLGDPSMVWVDRAGTLRVIDWRAGIERSYSPPSGRVALGAVFDPPDLAWLESEPGPRAASRVVLRRGEPTLEDAETLASWEVETLQGGSEGVTWLPFAEACAVDRTRFAVALPYTDEEVSETVLAVLEPQNLPALGPYGGAGVGTAWTAAGGGAARGPWWWGGGAGGETGPGWERWVPASWGAHDAAGALTPDGSTACLLTEGTVLEARVAAPGLEPDRAITLAPEPGLGLPVEILPLFTANDR